jgi:hypothetical protein
MRPVTLVLIGSLAALLAAVPATAAPQLDVAIGLSGRFLPDRFAPVRITLSGIETPFPGSIVVLQRIGTAWRGEAPSLTQSAYPVLTDGVYDLLVPIYDGTSPLLVSLCNEEGTVVATREIDLRQGRQERPFRTIVGDPGGLSTAEPTVQAERLPHQWLAYDGLSALWIARLSRPITESQWQGITRWVQAGGTLVLFTGLDFYLLDSPTLRGLLPFTDPTVERETGLLRGTPRPGSEPLVVSDNGSSLLVSSPYGFGTVLLATTRAEETPENVLQALASGTPDAYRVALPGASAALLDEMSLDHPHYTQAILLVVVCLVGVSILAAHVERPRARLFLLLGFAAALTVSCGLVANRTASYSCLYVSKTVLSIQRSFGINIDSYSLFTTHSTSGFAVPDAQIPVLQELPRDLRDARFDITTGSEGSTRLTLARGERRTLRGGSDCAASVSAYAAGDEQIEIHNGLEVSLERAVLFVDGIAFTIGVVPPGTTTYTLEHPTPQDGPFSKPEGLEGVLAAAHGLEALHEGSWLVAGRLTEQRDTTGTRRKVRVATVYVVEVVHDAPAI